MSVADAILSAVHGAGLVLTGFFEDSAADSPLAPYAAELIAGGWSGHWLASTLMSVVQ